MALEDEPELLEPALVVVVVVVGALVVVVVGVLVVVPDVLVVAVLAVGVPVVVVTAGVEAVATVLLRARAGSWPETSSTVISSHVATNRASALATTRRRMADTRAIRAWRIASPRALRSDGEGVMSVPLVTKMVGAT